VTGFRDPFVWKDGADWYAVIGSGIKDVGGAILLYRSKDLRTWEYLHPALVGDKAKTGDMWECPNFFPLGDKWVLMISTL
jgi:beta-fructofuranosidase